MPRVRYTNWWDHSDPADEWFSRFIAHHVAPRVRGRAVSLVAPRGPGRAASPAAPSVRSRAANPTNLHFVSCFGPRWKLEVAARVATWSQRDPLRRLIQPHRVVFFSGENLQFQPEFRDYLDHALDPPIALAIGTEPEEVHAHDPRYLRIPVWMFIHFSPEWGEPEWRNRYRELMHPWTHPDVRRAEPQFPGGRVGPHLPGGHATRPRFATLVARHGDKRGMRGRIVRAVEKLGPVARPSRFLHNDDRLQVDYGNDKRAYLRDFRFNLCPENSSYPGYVTEKLFDSFHSGTIPVYHGPAGPPEPQIVNSDAVIFWKDVAWDGPGGAPGAASAGGPGADRHTSPTAHNAATLRLIAELDADPRKYDEFAAQPRLHPGGEDWVVAKFEELIRRLVEVAG